jgi:hypothetical protein
MFHMGLHINIQYKKMSIKCQHDVEKKPLNYKNLTTILKHLTHIIIHKQNAAAIT